MSNVTKLKSIIESVAALALLVKLEKGHERTVMRLNRVVNRLKVVQLKYERTLARDAKGTGAKRAPVKKASAAKPAARKATAKPASKAKPAAPRTLAAKSVAAHKASRAKPAAAVPTTTVASSTASH